MWFHMEPLTRDKPYFEAFVIQQYKTELTLNNVKEKNKEL